MRAKLHQRFRIRLFWVIRNYIHPLYGTGTRMLHCRCNNTVVAPTIPLGVGWISWARGSIRPQPTGNAGQFLISSKYTQALNNMRLFTSFHCCKRVWARITSPIHALEHQRIHLFEGVCLQSPTIRASSAGITPGATSIKLSPLFWSRFAN